ncbi:MAG: DNA polymerase III subunit gamma/tau [Bacteroidales bacterium]
MDQFIVSARKYRPSSFEMVVGQEVVTTTLKNAIKNDQLAQAFLFCGPRGVGKTTCARILAKTINCQNLSDTFEACDECESCKSFSNNASLNIYELDAASNNSVEGIRSLVEQVRIPPQSGAYKVYIIDEVHMLSNSAFNAFLKTLEEPPSYAKFILATTEKHKILPTILSRCQIFDFRRIEISDIAKHLSFVAKKEGIAFEMDALNLIAEKADGALRDALSMFDQIVNATGKDLNYSKVAENLNVLDYDYFFKLSDHLVQKNITQILIFINSILGKGFDGHHLLLGLGNHFRNLLMSKDEETLNLLETSQQVKEKYKNQSKVFDTVLLVRSLELIGRADLEYRSSQNKRLFVELNLLQLAALHFPEGESQKKKLRLPPTELLTYLLKKEEEVKKEKKVEAKQLNTSAKVVSNVSGNIDKNRTGIRRSGTLSIRNYYNVQKQENGNQDGLQEEKRSKPFAQQDLNLAWSKFINAYRHEIRSFTNAIASSNPKILKGYEIAYEVQNDLISRDVINLSNLLAFLKDELSNDLIQLKAIKVATNVKRQYYTDQEKYHKLVKDFPLLSKLRESLDLELEF